MLAKKVLPFLKFGISGIIINSFGLAAFFLFVEILKISPAMSVSVLGPCFLLITYYSQKLLIFKGNQATSKALPLFFRNYFIVYALNVIGVFIFCDILNFNPLIVQIMHLFVLGAISFLLAERIFK